MVRAPDTHFHTLLSYTLRVYNQQIRQWTIWSVHEEYWKRKQQSMLILQRTVRERGENKKLREHLILRWAVSTSQWQLYSDSLSHMWRWMTSLTQPIKKKYLNTHWSGVLIALFGCYMAGATWNCCCLSACSVHQFTVSLHAKPHT